MVKIEDVLLTIKERKAIAEKAFKSGYFSQEALDKAIEDEDKAQCLKLLKVLEVAGKIHCDT